MSRIRADRVTDRAGTGGLRGVTITQEGTNPNAKGHDGHVSTGGGGGGSSSAAPPSSFPGAPGGKGVFMVRYATKG